MYHPRQISETKKKKTYFRLLSFFYIWSQMVRDFVPVVKEQTFPVKRMQQSSNSMCVHLAETHRNIISSRKCSGVLRFSPALHVVDAKDEAGVVTHRQIILIRSQLTIHRASLQTFVILALFLCFGSYICMYALAITLK